MVTTSVVCESSLDGFHIPSIPFTGDVLPHLLHVACVRFIRLFLSPREVEHSYGQLVTIARRISRPVGIPVERARTAKSKPASIANTPGCSFDMILGLTSISTAKIAAQPSLVVPRCRIDHCQTRAYCGAACGTASPIFVSSAVS